MNIGIIVIVIAAVLFVGGTAAVIILDSRLSENGSGIENMSNAQFSRFCIGISISVAVLLIGLMSLIVGVILTLAAG